MDPIFKTYLNTNYEDMYYMWYYNIFTNFKDLLHNYGIGNDFNTKNMKYIKKIYEKLKKYEELKKKRDLGILLKTLTKL